MIEVAIGLMGLALSVLGVVLGYIWRANSRLAKMLLEGQERMQKGMEVLQKGMEGIALMVRDVHEGQKEMMKLLAEIYKKI
ncbi:MAG: hypothetical protein QXD66_03435 [Candidatus Nezhaarchaeales archaeon]|nr:hypothetical protein [Candidatus Nezhaarchaeota archaeon]TDA34049.1 MAG: hypothetical protein DSO05_07075 [Candidatus Nezhaarchaeota archaeon WYZ-LMO7]TDA34127.1 MAG: hypothetical protein DSO06_06240 [Candidatus Nezhaarchaeota archaeon WYZ-LMO8]